MRQKQVPLSLLVYGLLGLAAPTAGCGDGGESASGAPPGSFHVRPTTDLPGARRFLVVAEPGEIPAVAEQLTARGRSVGTLAPMGSRIFLGFGDFSNNTGPIRAVSYDVQSGRFETGALLETEEILDFQVHASRLFAAALDPLGDEALGSVFRLDSADTWRAMPDIPDAVHTFGMAEFRGQLFVGTGCAQGGGARVAVTSDSGETWYDSHITPVAATAFARYTHLGATNEQLFVSGRIHAEPSVAFAYVFDGQRWDAISSVPTDGFLIPLIIGDEFFIHQFSGDRGKGGKHLGNYQLEAHSLVPSEPLLASETFVNWSQSPATEVSPARTWVLTEASDGTQSIYFSESATSWQLVSKLPSLPNADSFTSIAYLDDTIYLGTASGGLFAVEEIFELAGGA